MFLETEGLAGNENIPYVNLWSIQRESKMSATFEFCSKTCNWKVMKKYAQRPSPKDGTQRPSGPDLQQPWLLRCAVLLCASAAA